MISHRDKQSDNKAGGVTESLVSSDALSLCTVADGTVYLLCFMTATEPAFENMLKHPNTMLKLPFVTSRKPDPLKCKKEPKYDSCK